MNKQNNEYIKYEWDAQEMPKPHGQAFPRHQKKERWETNNDKKRHISNYRRTSKEELKHGNHLELSVKKTVGFKRAFHIALWKSVIILFAVFPICLI